LNKSENARNLRHKLGAKNMAAAQRVISPLHKSTISSRNYQNNDDEEEEEEEEEEDEDDEESSSSSVDEQTIKFHSLAGDEPAPVAEQQPCVVVSRTGERDFTTIQAAIDSVASGTLVMVEPGEYCESLTLDVDKEIVVAGTGNFAAVCIVAEDDARRPEAGECLTVRRGTALFNNVTFRHESAAGVAAVLISGGVAKFKGCEIASRNHIGVRVAGRKTQCQMSGSSVRHCFRSGIDVQQVCRLVYMCVWRVVWGLVLFNYEYTRRMQSLLSMKDVVSTTIASASMSMREH
jgi:hypothetical protein